MFKLTKISIELAVLLLLSGFVFLYVILTRYFALLLLVITLVTVYKVAKHYNDNKRIADRAVAIYKQEYNKSLPLPPDQPSCVKLLPNPPDTEVWLYPPSNKNIEQQVEKFRQELNQD